MIQKYFSRVGSRLYANICVATDLYLKDLTCMCWFRELVVCTCDFVLICGVTHVYLKALLCGQVAGQCISIHIQQG